MSFRGLLRPGQGFKRFRILRRVGETTKTGRARTGEYEPQGELLGMITEASPTEIEQFKQRGTPITHTIVQRGTATKARAGDTLELHFIDEGKKKVRKFNVVGDPKNPGELGHFLIYRVEERKDLK